MRDRDSHTPIAPRDATRGGVNDPALPGQRGRESPLWINMLPKYLGEWVTQS